MVPLIDVSTHADSRLEAYRSVRDPDLARRLGLFVAEGRLVVERLIAHRPELIQSVLVSPSAAQALHRQLSGLAAPVYLAPSAELEAVTGFSFHQGCLALAYRPPPLSFDNISAFADLVLVLESLTNVDNVGSAFRTAAAFGAAVVLSPTCSDPFYRKAIRTSMAAVLTVPSARLPAWPDGLDMVRGAGYTVVALSPDGPVTLQEFAANPLRARRLAVVVGSEGRGLSLAVERYAEARLRIPVQPDVDSLNVGVAIGIALSRLSER